jgi:hypothetical protein
LPYAADVFRRGACAQAFHFCKKIGQKSPALPPSNALRLPVFVLNYF